MRKPPLVYRLIQSFTPRERKDFRLYLESRKGRLRLAVLELGYRLIASPNDEPREVYDSLRQRLPSNQLHSANQLNSWLYQEAKAFLLGRLHAEDELPLVAEFQRRNLPDHQTQLLKQLRKKANNTPFAFRRDYEISRAEEYHVPRQSRTSDHNFQHLSDTLDLDYLVEKLRWACSMRSHENVYKVSYNYGILDLILPQIEALQLTKNPLVAAYYHAHQFLTSPEAAEHYQQFQAILQQDSVQFPQSDQRELYLLGINYLIRRVNQNDPVAGQAALELYKAGLEKNIFIQGGDLSPPTFRNAVALALSLKDFPWAEQFIDDYSPQLPKDQQEDLRHYNLARLAHAKGDNDTALEELRYLRPKDSLFLLSSEVFRAKIYYEQAAFSLLDAHLDKMNSYLKRNKNSYHATNYQAFIKYCRKLCRLNPHDQTARENLWAEIATTTVMTEKKWLLAQL